MIFEKLRNETPYEMNQRVGKYWKDNKVFEKSIKKTIIHYLVLSEA